MEGIGGFLRGMSEPQLSLSHLLRSVIYPLPFVLPRAATRRMRARWPLQPQWKSC